MFIYYLDFLFCFSHCMLACPPSFITKEKKTYNLLINVSVDWVIIQKLRCNLKNKKKKKKNKMMIILRNSPPDLSTNASISLLNFPFIRAHLIRSFIHFIILCFENLDPHYRCLYHSLFLLCLQFTNAHLYPLDNNSSNWIFIFKFIWVILNFHFPAIKYFLFFFVSVQFKVIYR